MALKHFFQMESQIHIQYLPLQHPRAVLVNQSLVVGLQCLNIWQVILVFRLCIQVVFPAISHTFRNYKRRTAIDTKLTWTFWSTLASSYHDRQADSGNLPQCARDKMSGSVLCKGPVEQIFIVGEPLFFHLDVIIVTWSGKVELLCFSTR